MNILYKLPQYELDKLPSFGAEFSGEHHFLSNSFFTGVKVAKTLWSTSAQPAATQSGTLPIMTAMNLFPIGFHL